MSDLITFLVISFNLFAEYDNFGIMVGKIQEGWGKDTGQALVVEGQKSLKILHFQSKTNRFPI